LGPLNQDQPQLVEVSTSGEPLPGIHVGPSGSGSYFTTPIKFPGMATIDTDAR
jgi:hypothetical protein